MSPPAVGAFGADRARMSPPAVGAFGADRARRCPALVSLLAAVLLLASPTPAEGKPEDNWRWLLDRAAQSAEEMAYAGEALWVTYDDGSAHVSRYQIRSSGDGAISLADSDDYAVRLGDDGGGLADHERGWFVPLPAADLAKAHKGLSRLEEKYQVDVIGTQRLLDRKCTTLEIRARNDDRLVERLWVDDRSGLLLRRETYDGESRLLRLVTYLALDLNPGRSASVANDAAPRGQRPDMERREQQVAEIDEAGLQALRDAGWTVPDILPGGYRPDGSFAVSAADSQPLQIVYSDGLYTVSLFEQRGTPDLASLPPGAQKTTRLGFEAWAWPGAVPQRLVWEASGTTYSLVGDAPPREFQAIATSLPRPEPVGFGERLRRGLSRLWSWVSPWS